MQPKSVIDLLYELGPCLSSTLVAAIQKKFGLSAVASRKRIERAKRNGELRTLEDIRFSHNELLFFLDQQRFQKDFAQRVLQILVSSNSIYRIPILGLMARGGAVPVSLFSVISGLPISARRLTTKTSATTLQKLLQAGLLERDSNLVRVSRSIFPRTASTAKIKSRIIIENACLAALKDYFALQGLISAGKCQIRNMDQTPQFAFFHWDFVAPTFTRPIATTGMPGFIVADVILGRILTTNDVYYFAHKCAEIRASLTHRPFMALLVATWFDKEALKIGRQEGLVFSTPRNLFGPDFSVILDFMGQVFEQKKEFFVAKPDFLQNTLDKLDRLRDWPSCTSLIRQWLFVFLVGDALQNLGATIIEYISPSENSADIIISFQGKPTPVFCKFDLTEHLDAFGSNTGGIVCTAGIIDATLKQTFKSNNLLILDANELEHVSPEFKTLCNKIQPASKESEQILFESPETDEN